MRYTSGRWLSLEFLEDRHLLTSGPFISEFVATNSTGLQDIDGAFSDWLEISNPSTSGLSLDGWYLTDNVTDLTQWRIPAVTIPAGGQLLIFASSKDRIDPAGELHTNFKLSASGEYLGLIQPDGVTIASQFAPAFPPQSPDISYGFVPVGTDLLLRGATSKTLVPSNGSLGVNWTQQGFDDATWTQGTTGVGYSTDGSLSSLIGTDVQSAMLNIRSSAYVRVPFSIADLSNVDALILNMQFDDGFVAYINGTEVARKNAPLSPQWDSVATASQPSGIPTVEQFDLSSYLGLLQAGSNILAVQGLNDSASGDDFLVSPELIAYKLNTPPPTFLASPTPNAINLATVVSQVAQLQFSQARGFYDTPFDLQIMTATPSATIRYTLDGSPPTTTTGTVYTGPIPVSSTSIVRALAYKLGMQPTSVSTQSYLFLDNIIHQPAIIPGYPNELSDVGLGQSVIGDYEMDPDIVNSPTYGSVVRTGLLSIPSLSISVSLTDMFGSDGFYHNDVEKPASIEVIDPNNPAQNLQVNGGIEPHSHDRLKRSLRLSFKSAYGPSKWVTDLLKTAPLNGSSASNELDNIVLRAGNNRAWTRIWNPDATTFTEDQWYRDSQIAMQGFGSHGTFVHLYINGIYWGLYNPSERPDEAFSSEYFGGSEDDWFSINHDGRTRGDRTRWDYLRGPLIAKDMSVAANYAELQQYLDVDKFSDYLILNWYQATTDWPGNNWFNGNRNDGTIPTQYYAWDGEWSWDRGLTGPVNGAWVHPDFRNGSMATSDLANIWRSLKNNPDFQQRFADRAYVHLFNNGALTDANSIARWDTLNNYVRDAVVAESARWGDALESLGQPTRTRNVDWQNEVNNIASLMNGNVSRMISALRGQGFYPSIDAPTMSQQGGTVPNGFILNVSTPAGATAVYYTLDGSDPRLPGGVLSPSAILYNPSTGIPLTQSGQVRVRAIANSEWSSINSAAFTVLPTSMLAVTNLALINADSDLPIPGFTALTPGTVLNLATLPTRNLNIRADVSGSAGSVQFGLNGNANFRIETFPPYALFGDSNGDYNAGTFAVGSYALTATPFSGGGASGQAGQPLAISFSVIDQVLGNTPPVVNAGPDQSITLPASALLAGTATDDGLPNNTLTTTWSTVSGPGTVTFANANQLSTSASFSIAGSYTLRLTASDGVLSSSDDVIVSVAPPTASSAVTQFALINADTDLPIPGFTPLTSGMVLNLATLPTGNLNVRADTLGTVGSVRFGLNANANFRTENVPPYALFGDNGGDYIAGAFDVGSYTLTATPFAGGGASGQMGQSLTVAFSVIDQPDNTNTPPVVNAGPDQGITLPASAALVGTATDDGLPNNTLTTTWSAVNGPGTVTFGNPFQLSTTASFSIPGSYTLRLTASDGVLSSSDDVVISVAPPVPTIAVTNLALINAVTDLPISGFMSMTNGMILNLATLPTRSLNLRADVVGSVGSVRFELNGNSNFRTENVAPYALFGDNNGDYVAGNFSIGNYSLTATPFTGTGGSGQAGQPINIQFTVIDQPANVSNENSAVDLPLESRGSWTLNRYDTNRNGTIEPLDALLVINALSRRSASVVTSSEDEGALGNTFVVSPTFVDLNSDQRLMPLDALLVINEIARNRHSGSVESEFGSYSMERRLPDFTPIESFPNSSNDRGPRSSLRAANVDAAFLTMPEWLIGLLADRNNLERF